MSSLMEYGKADGPYWWLYKLNVYRFFYANNNYLENIRIDTIKNVAIKIENHRDDLKWSVYIYGENYYTQFYWEESH